MTLAFQKGWNRDALNAIILIVLTGCRKGEIEKLRWSEVDMKGRLLRLEDTKEGPSVRPLGKAAVELLKTIRQEDEQVFHGRGESKRLKSTGPIWQQIRALSPEIPSEEVRA